MIKQDNPRENQNGFFSSAPRFPKVRKQHNFSEFVDGITLSVVGILVVVILMMYLTDVTFTSSFSLKEFGFAAFVMYACTVSIYLLLRSYSGRRGKRTKDYIDICEEIEKNANSIIEKGFAAYTANYCRAWEKEELDNAREQILSEVGLSVKVYNEKYCQYSDAEIGTYFPNLSELQKKAISLARKCYEAVARIAYGLEFRNDHHVARYLLERLLRELLRGALYEKVCQGYGKLVGFVLELPQMVDLSAQIFVGVLYYVHKAVKHFPRNLGEF